jgi:uncharacterized cupredoxin-like copper-binding protein
MRKTTVLPILVLCLSLLLSACGGGGQESASTKIDVQLTEFMFQPTQFTVPAGEEITLDVANNGAILHNFVIMNLGTQVTMPFDEDDKANVYWEVALNPGGSTSTTFTAPSDPGEYQVVCSTAGHVEAGMIGKLTVVAP